MIEKDPVLEGIMTQLGEFGRYQFRQHFYHLLTSFLAGIHMLALTFTAPEPESRCFIPQVDEFNGSIADLPLYIPKDSDGELDTCLKFRDLGNLTFSNETVSCGGHYFYNSTYYPSSRVIEWDMVCDRRWMRALLQSVYMAGVLCGAVILGSLADSFGRKPILYISGICQLVFGLVCAFAPYYYMYAAGLFFYGAFGSAGAYVTGFVLTMELVGPSKRTICGTMFSVTFAFGVMLVSFWAWLIPNVQLLQIIYASHSLLLVGHWWLVDESIRWLWGKGRTKEALAIASKGIEVNGKYFVDYRTQQNPEHLAPTRQSSLSSETITEDSLSLGNAKAGLIDLLRLPTLRFRTLIMAYTWFGNSLVYYGLAFNIGSLPGNPFFMSFLNGLVELPAYVMVVTLLDRTGRRSLESVLLFIGGLACVVVAFIPHGVLTITVSMIAKVAVAGSFAICFNYAAELFPTVIRNTVIGITTMAARGAGMLAPEIILLDSIGHTLPTIIFGSVAVLAAILCLFLPETLNKEMPQTIEDGENFEKGDTAFRTIWRCFKRRRLSHSSRRRLR